MEITIPVCEWFERNDKEFFTWISNQYPELELFKSYKLRIYRSRRYIKFLGIKGDLIVYFDLSEYIKKFNK